MTKCFSATFHMNTFKYFQYKNKKKASEFVLALTMCDRWLIYFKLTESDCGPVYIYLF